MAAGLIRTVPSRWDGTILVCGKCSRKVGGGFGDKGRTPLAKALRRLLELKKGRKARAGVVEVKCLGLCPKGAVTVVDAARPDEWRIIPAGTDIVAIAKEFGLDSAA
ncbi:(2Fe-2S) ferredoxin domain-containing protein [Sphingomonas sp.]|uniref:(2Fe-2S) ferredoxin domain-containing protein n=1 Tax=Sphingomonas sp. TaxID=28214 RepID=UPI002DD6311C|nr:(2Fe-2S) ferredoxin domain-containing protein [Sphingomonas sp.]